MAPGYEPEAAVFARVDIWSMAFSWTQEERTAYHRRVLDIAARSPAIDAAALTSGLPIGSGANHVTARDGFADGFSHPAAWVHVTPGSFRAHGIPLLLGRDFDEGDTVDRPRVAIVSADLAARIWPDRKPLGQHLTFSPGGPARRDTRPPVWLEVVGVAGSVRSPLSEGAPTPVVYASLWQDGVGDLFVARARGPHAEAERALRDAMEAADSRVGIAGSGRLSDVAERMRRPRRLAAAVLGGLGLTGLLLACVGVYGVLSHSVSQRYRELGIRISLGAGRRQIMRLVMREAAAVVAVGTVVGLVLSISAVRLASTQLTGPVPVGTGVFVGAALVLAAAVFTACYLPACRAVHVDPAVILREP